MEAIVVFAIFALGAIGMTNIIVDSKIFATPRKWLEEQAVAYAERGGWLRKIPALLHEIVECHQCCGFWCGLIGGAILLSHKPLILLLCGCAGSFLASFAYLVTELILSKTEISFPVDEVGANDEQQ